MTRAFISYSSKDAEVVRQLVLHVRGHGIDIWHDETGLEGGDRLAKIKQELTTSDFFILVMSNNSVESPWVQKEIQWALDHVPIRIIPFKIDGCDSSRFPARVVQVRIIDYSENPEGAKSELVRILLQKSGQFQALMRQGRFCVAQRRFEEAIRYFSSALKRRPQSPIALRYRAFAYRRAGRTQEALRDIAKVVAQAPGDVQALVLKARLFVESKDYGFAIKDCDMALGLDPTNVHALAARGRANSLLKRYGEAVRDFGKARSLAPRNHGVLKSLGMALNESGQVPEAADVFAEAVSQDPGDRDCRFLLGYALHQLGRHQEATHQYLKAADLDRSFFRVWYCLGYARYELKDFEKSREAFSQAIEIARGLAGRSQRERALCAASAFVGRGRVHLAMTRLDDAASDAEEAILLNASDKRARLLKARVLFEAKSFPEALHACKAVFRHGACAETYDIAASVCAEIGREEDAAKYRRGAESLRGTGGVTQKVLRGIRGMVLPTPNGHDLKPAEYIRAGKIHICKLRGFQCRGTSCW